MNADFISVHNYRERAVFSAVAEAAELFPDFADDPDILADVACVALNRLQPRYIRHQVDYAFYLTDEERQNDERLVTAAVESAFLFVRSRLTKK
jgi:Late competence development protein ComFB